MSFKKVTEEASLYNDLGHKSVEEPLQDTNVEDQRVALTVQKTVPQTAKLVKLIVPRMKQGGHILYMRAGTSDRLGVLNASKLPPTFGVSKTLVTGLIASGDTALRNAAEAAEGDKEYGWNELAEHNIDSNDTVIGTAASGTMSYVVGTLHDAREYGTLTVCITNNPDSPMAIELDIAIEMIVGPEYVTGNSRMKSSMGQKTILNMISTVVMI